MDILQPGNYFGKTIRKKEISDFILSENVYRQHGEIPLHSHENFYLRLVVQGRYSENYRNQRVMCTAGNVIVHPNYVEHSNVFNSATVTCFNIEVNDLEAKGIQLGNLSHQRIDGGLVSTGLLRVYDEFLGTDPFSPLIIEGMLLETIGRLGRQTADTNPRWLTKAVAFIKDNDNRNISLADVASVVRLSPAYLARAFRQRTGLSVGSFIQHDRIQRSCELLKKQKSDILSVALECGFADHSHFTRVFHKVMKITPSQYKKISS